MSRNKSSFDPNTKNIHACIDPDIPLYGGHVIPQCLMLLFPFLQRWHPNTPVQINSFVKDLGKKRILLDENIKEE